MSNDKNDMPVAGHNPNLEYDRDRADFTPEKGRLFVKDKSGAVLLTQTKDTFGSKKKS